MENEPQKVHLFGMSPMAIIIQLSLLREKFENCDFHIYKNIEVNKEPDFPINADAFQLSIHSAGFVPQLSEISSDILLFGVPGPKAKESVFTYFQRKSGILKKNYSTFLHSTAYISGETEIAEGVFVEPKAVISTQSTIDFGVHLKRGVLVGHHNKIGKYCEINPGVVLSGNVEVGEKTIIGSGSVVKDGVKIGSNSLIGMGSNVVGDIPSGVIAFGNPCKVVRKNKAEE